MVEGPQRIVMSINTGVRYAVSGRPGAVYIDVPAEIINAPVEREDVYFPAAIGDPPRPQGDPRAVEEALRVLRTAERPLMIIGKGTVWSWAEDELQEFVDKVQMPFLTSAMGMVRTDHPMCVAGARSQAIKNADVMLLIGARFNWILHFGLPPRFARGVKVIQIDITAEEIGRNVPAPVGIIGDAKIVLAQLNAAWNGNPVTHDEADWIPICASMPQKIRRRFSRCWTPTRCPYAIIAAIARSGISFPRILSSSPMAPAHGHLAPGCQFV